jgi:NADP-dependent 3-hydroxy acid dehydrogenase YdfG
VDVDGNVAVVAGAAAGIGRAVARALAEASAEVVLADVDAEAGQRAAREIGCGFAQTDVLADNAVRDLIAGADPLAILVNNAGGAPAPYHAQAPSLPSRRPGAAAAKASRR